MNCNRIPFMPPYPEPIVYTDREGALSKRVRGEKLLAPVGLKEGKLVDIVLKACQFNPKERYQDATHMKEELIKLLDSEEEIVILSPSSEEPKAKVGAPVAKKKVAEKMQVPEEEEEPEEIERTLLIDKEELPVPPQVKQIERPSKEKKRAVIIGGLVVVVIGLTAITYGALSGYSKLKAEEVVAKSGSFKAVLGPLQEQLDRYIAEQMVEDEPIEEEEVKPIVPEVIVPGGEPQAEPEETSGNEEEIVETTEKAPVKEEQPTPEPTIPPEEKEIGRAHV